MKSHHLLLAIFLSTVPSATAFPSVPLVAFDSDLEESPTVKRISLVTSPLYEGVQDASQHLEHSPILPRANSNQAVAQDCSIPPPPTSIFVPQTYDFPDTGVSDTSPKGLETHQIDFQKLWTDISELQCDTIALQRFLHDYNSTKERLTWSTVDRKMVLKPAADFDLSCKRALEHLLEKQPDDPIKGFPDNQVGNIRHDQRAFLGYVDTRKLVTRMMETLRYSIPDALQAFVDRRAEFEAAATYPEQGNDLVVDSLRLMMDCWDNFTNSLLAKCYRRDAVLNRDADALIFWIHDLIERAIWMVRP